MSDLSALTHRQWSLKVLVELLRGPDKKSGALARRLDVSRQTLLATLKALTAQGLVEGDQAEPALTRKGEKVAERGEALLSALEKAGATEQRKWALPILHALGKKPQRFGELKAAMPTATPRAISMALKDLVEAGLVDRKVLDGFPPRTEYGLQAKARSLAPLLEQVAKL
jgi:DNA-binding HxlR family transcriptional regulator